MKEHFIKYQTIYVIIFIIICTLLSSIFIYLGRKYKNNTSYTEEEAIGIMKLKADTLTRMLEISNEEDTCETSNIVTLTSEELNKYGFDTTLYQQVSYKPECNEKQIYHITIIGNGDFKGFELKDYVSNQKK